MENMPKSKKNWIPNIILVLQLKFQNWSISEAAKSNVAIRFFLVLNVFVIPQKKTITKLRSITSEKAKRANNLGATNQSK